MNAEKCAVIAGIAMAFCCFLRNKIRRRPSVREMHKDRQIHGFFERNFQKMKKCDPEQFFMCTRMTADTFDLLLNLLKEKLTKCSIRTPISPECLYHWSRGLQYSGWVEIIQYAAWISFLSVKKLRGIKGIEVLSVHALRIENSKKFDTNQIKSERIPAITKTVKVLKTEMTKSWKVAATINNC